MVGLTQKDKIKVCGEEFEFDKEEMENLYLFFSEVKRIKNSRHCFGEVSVLIQHAKIVSSSINQTLKARDSRAIKS